MKKKILLIGNDDGLPGVKVDLRNYKEYFKSDRGGRWYDSEIIEKLNPRKSDLIQEIISLTAQKLDYLIVIFSGHGGQERETVFELNSSGEIINESVLFDISTKQLNIYDCCRAYSESNTKSIRLTALMEGYAYNYVRTRFEERILKASDQQIKLYACSKGEVANDTSQGGAYSKNLIKSAYNSSSEFILVGSAHTSASEMTNQEFPKQHPDAILPRLLSSQQLIFGIN
ncbi:MAG: caspase family protein [Bacteroidales bacterium]